jgi:hypothetical protein
MRFQLVLQWPLSSLNGFDEILNIEDVLIAKLTDQSDVDGHDFGSGEADIFVHTNDPHRTLKEVRDILADHRLWPSIVIAFRETQGNEYTVLWPEVTTEFNVR